MNKKQFVTKYEYLHYYTRCNSVLFLKNAEIEEVIQQSVKNLHDLDVDDNDESNEEIDNELIDSYEEYRELLWQKQTIDVNELQANNQEDSPQIIEGLMIDKLAKKYLQETYHADIVIDYDDEKYQSLRYDNELAAKQTYQDLLKNAQKKQCIIYFQPTFIAKTLNGTFYVTKCDALVQLPTGFELIEVKGTTSSKRIHFMDFLYQKWVLENNLYDSLVLENCNLCLVEYCRAKKWQVPLTLTKYCNLSKTPPQLNLKNFGISDEKTIVDLKQKYKKGRYLIPLLDALNEHLSPDDFVDIFENYPVHRDKPFNTRDANTVNSWLALATSLNETFEHTIDQISLLKKLFDKTKIHLTPCQNCKSAYKNCEYFPKCRELFKLAYKNGDITYLPFTYSGLVKNFNNQLADFANLKADLHYELTFKEKFASFKDQVDTLNVADVLKLWELLQSRVKRVYFDFESINTALRPMDDVFPFNQVITQNSIIKTNNFYDEYYCEDMIIDPKKIDLTWIKSLIDHLYEEEECWYIVYNKNFECTRLKEMAALIKEKAYTDKVQKIVENVFDLALFFQQTEKCSGFLLKDLKGFYSIKKVLELIPQVILDETKTVSYHSLEVYNGAVAQNVTTKRFFNLIDDEQWALQAKNLQTYCQNDVRAMIAVEKFVHYLLVKKQLIN